jgi:hypothetical protein
LKRGLALGLIALALVLAILLFLAFVPSQHKASLKATMYLTPDCNCCKQYIKYLESEGISVDEVLVDAQTLYETMKVAPPDLWSCHILELEGYYVIGHVPAEAINKLVTERPNITGISLPGMPPGSPGMPGKAPGPLTVYYFTGQSVGVYARVNV